MLAASHEGAQAYKGGRLRSHMHHPRTWLSLFRTSACGSWMRCARCAISTRAYGSISRARFLHANHFYEIRPESIVRI